MNLRKLLGNFLALIVLTFALWFRLPAITRETTWAEDGGAFLRDILDNGLLQSIGLPYDGYLHVLPRTLASVAYGLAPLEGYAVAMSLLSCAVVAGVAVAVFHLSRSILEPVALRLMLAAIPILLPVGPHEVLGNAANLHWYLLWLSPWLLLDKPRSPVAKGLLFFAALVIASSEIITALFAPLAIWSLVRRRNVWAPAGMLLGLGLQFLTTLTSPRFETEPPGAGVDPLSILYGFFLLPVGSIWHVDSRTLAQNIVDFGGGALLIPTLLVLALLVFALVTGRRDIKIAALIAITAAVAVWWASVAVNGKSTFNYATFGKLDWETGFGYLRYAAAPGMFLLTLVPFAAATAAERFRVRDRLPLLAATAAFVLFLLPGYLPPDTTRRDGPLWSTGVQDARAKCVDAAGLQNSTVLVAPTTWKFAQVQISCDVLRSK